MISALHIWNNAGKTKTAIATFGPHKIGRIHKNPNSKKPELKIVTLGDTGCRGLHSRRKSLRQYCGSEATWPLQKISDMAAKTSPDSVVHVGDYRYYKGSNRSDNWAYWLKDFVAPSQSLLLAAPWALIRGNHEDCASAGKGYFYLFGAEAAVTRCDANSTASWYFDIAPGGFDASGKAKNTHRFVMIDTSADSTSEAQTNFAKAIDFSDQESTWWATHIAPVHLINFGRNPSQNGNIADGLNLALKAKGAELCNAKRNPKPACIPSTLLLGHDHMFQTVQFKTTTGRFEYPQMYIVGHGGVNLRGAGLNGSPCRYNFKKLPGRSDDLGGIVNTRKDFGYVVWTRSQGTANEPAGWTSDEIWVSSNGTASSAENCF